MGYLLRMGGSTWGPPLCQMRHLYVTKIRPMIAYGCPVWFLYGKGVKWSISNPLLKELNSLQYQCLVQIAGAYSKTCGDYLHKELYIESIETFLTRTAMAFRAREMEIPESELLSGNQGLPGSSETCTSSTRRPSSPYVIAHPYDVLDAEAENVLRAVRKQLQNRTSNAAKIWADPKERAKAITKYLRKVSNDINAKHWDECREQRRGSWHERPILLERWGSHNLKYYEGLSRPQSTMLLQCRAGFNGFKKHLKLINVCHLTSENSCDWG